MVPPHTPKTFAENITGAPLAGPMVEHRRRVRWREAEIYRNAVSLLRPYPVPRLIEGKAPLIVADDHLLKLGAGDPEPPARTSREQRVHPHPTAGL